MTLNLRYTMLPLLLLHIMMVKCAAQEPRLELVSRDGHVDDFHGGGAAPYRDFRGLLLDEQEMHVMYPLLTFVFFDRGSAAIGERYIRFNSPEQASRFTDTTIPGGTLQKYYQVLNIIGYRMRAFPGTRIEVVGSFVRDSAGAETKAVAERRCGAVRDYLTEVWGIDPGRIAPVPVRDPMDIRASERDSLRAAEDRRVEIRSTDWEIAKPVVNHDLRRSPAPDDVRFRMWNGIDDRLVARRAVEIRRHGSPWHVITEIGSTDTITAAFNWGMNGDPDRLPEDEAPYAARLMVYGTDGSEHRSPGIEIPVEIVTQKKLIRYGFIDSVVESCWIPFFTSMEGKPGPLNERIVQEFICRHVRPGSRVEVFGQTDIIGQADRNRRLSEQHAQMVAGVIRRCAATVPNVSYSVVGLGEESPLFGNDTPEGRCYNRMVSVRVTSPAGE